MEEFIKQDAQKNGWTYGDKVIGGWRKVHNQELHNLINL
jgi:hypothetical protein